jgi:hypothetical protein
MYGSGGKLGIFGLGRADVLRLPLGFPLFLSSGLRKYAILDLNPLTKYSYEMLHQGTCCAT